MAYREDLEINEKISNIGSPFHVTRLPKGTKPATHEIAARITSGVVIVQG